MSGFEWNKIAAAVLIAGLVAMIVGLITDALYEPELKPEKRGYEIAGVAEAPAPGQKAEKEVPVDIPALLAKADPEKGKAATAKCASCHDFTSGGPNKIGPNLFGVAGRAKGSHDGYSYSDAMKAKGGKWSADDLYHFINGPRAFVPGTKMSFAGIAKPQDVANVVAYLKTLK